MLAVDALTFANVQSARGQRDDSLDGLHARERRALLRARQPSSDAPADPEENFTYGDSQTFEDAYGVVDRGGHVDVGDAPGIVPVLAEAGSMVVWHGNTWHGAFNRTAPGIRATFVLVFANRHLRPQEPYPDVIPEEAFARHDEDFATLVGRGIDIG